MATPRPSCPLNVSTAAVPLSLTAVAAGDAAPSTVATRSDHELMLAVRDGELARLGDLFERHHGPLYGFFVRMTGDRGASEDLVQIVFHRILRYRHTYRDEGNFTAWLYQIARKAAFGRRRLSRRESLDDDGGSGEVEVEKLPDDRPHAADRAATRDDVALLHRALDTLSPDQREVLVLARFQQLKHEEIAELFEISTGAVKARVHRAFHELRDVFFKLSRKDHA